MTDDRNSMNVDFVRRRLGGIAPASGSEGGSQGGDIDAYCNAAAVLARFELFDLKAFPETATPAIALPGFLEKAVPVDDPTDLGHRVLTLAARRAALQRLGTREKMRLAREQNVAESADQLQVMTDLLLSGEPIDFDGLSRSQMASLLIVLTWFEGILPDLPEAAALQRRFALLGLLAPMHKLIGRHGEAHVGRQHELQVLKDYVGILPADSAVRSAWRFIRSRWQDLTSRPMLMIYGPGGIGKSSLLAKFILEHIDGPQAAKLPFVYLDFDRKSLDLQRQSSLLVEAANQLIAQFPEIHDVGESVKLALASASRSHDYYESSKSNTSVGDLFHLAQTLANALPNQDAPILFVLDTFEEVQFLGSDFVSLLLNFLEELQRVEPRLRIVVSGRTAIRRHTPMTYIELTEFDQPSALAYLERQLSSEKVYLSKEDLAKIINIVGRVPLSLTMAVRVIKREGIEALQSKSLQGVFFQRLRTEKIQSVLFDRIIAHVHGANSKVGAKIRDLLATGLVVRRVTPDVIREVLAGPCGVSLSPEEPEEIYAALAKETSLFDVDETDPHQALRLRSDVRSIVLPDVLASGGARLKQIDEAAVRYYSEHRNVAASLRAEEIFHRLRLGEEDDTIDAIWDDDVAPYLRGAAPELDAKSQVYLANMLGALPDSTLLAEAGQQRWEDITYKRVRAYLYSDSRDARSALGLLRERRERLPGSRLLLLEAEALRLAGRHAEALSVLDHGILTIQSLSTPDFAYLSELQRLAAVIEESRSDLPSAFNSAAAAEASAKMAGDTFGEVQSAVAQLRLLRKGPGADGEVLRRISGNLQRSLSPDVLDELRQRPNLTKEVVAEVGASDDRLIRFGLETVGLDVKEPGQATLLVQALSQWDSQANTQGQIAESLQVRSPQGAFDWVTYVKSSDPAVISIDLKRLIDSYPMQPQTRELFAQQFQANVDSAIAPSVPVAPIKLQ